MTAAQLEKVLQNWQQVKENEWLASCPFPENHNHGDVHPSLVITEKGEKGGEVLRVGDGVRRAPAGAGRAGGTGAGEGIARWAVS